MEVVKSQQNILVSAGPGAGKSELLAQKANYLLQTNTCPYPKKILAISFKKDAKSNLSERVEERCGRELSTRFKSLTFDGFAKHLIDQFRMGLPEKYRPTQNYQIASEDILKNVFLQHYPEFKNYKKSKLKNNIYRELRESTNFPDLNKKIHNVWLDLLHNNGTEESQLTFSMISILARYLIHSNPKIQRALNITYSHVFLDEFQDTTLIQYELTKACFLNMGAQITAVGDSKQRIMSWAGAMQNIFGEFKKDFEAIEIELLMNYRSAPRLIELQSHLYPLLQKDKIEITTPQKPDLVEGEANLHYFDDCEQEATMIAQEIQELIDHGTNQRKIVILIKHSLPRYTNKIQEKLFDLDIRSRDEGVFQDLLTEEVVKFILSTLYLSMERDADRWLFLMDFMFSIHKLDDNPEEGIDELYSTIDEILYSCDVKLKELSAQNTSEDLLELIKELIGKIGYENIAAIFEQYGQEEYFWQLLSKTSELLWKEYLRYENWKEALEGFGGKDTIPIMTIHKSKGLEYDAVFFIGLEDGAFFSYPSQTYEDNCTFFVAVSRAKERVDFTFSSYRESDLYPNQTYNTISELHDSLKDSGVVAVLDHSRSAILD